jgi:hypothetical protein
MDALRQDVLICLRHAKKHVEAHQIAQVVGARVGDVYDELGYLVRHGAAHRHHCDDAVLRYSLADAKAVPAADPVITPHQKRPRIHLTRAAPKADAVLAKMGNAPIALRAIVAACDGHFSLRQVANLLQVLKRRGAVKRLSGSTCNAKWQRVAPTQQADQ